MGKITFLALLLIVVGIAGGVIEIQVHPDKIAALPSTLLGLSQDASLLERGRTMATSFKRQGEFWIVRDEEQRLELAISYIEKDAERLTERLEEEEEPSAILPQAQLLTESIERAQNVTEDSSVDTIASFRQDTKEAFSAASATVAQLQEAHEEFAELQQRFASVVATLEQQIGSFAFEEETESGEVAGSQDSSPTPAPSLSIPLQF